MFNFMSPLKRRRVQAVLTSRVNQKCMTNMQGVDRVSDRTSFVRALAVVPGTTGNWRFDEAFPAFTSDISPTGLSILHFEKIEGEVLVEVPGETTSSFLRCTVRYCNDLGYGYFQIGLMGRDVVRVDYHQSEVLAERMAIFTNRSLPEETSDTQGD